MGVSNIFKIIQFNLWAKETKWTSSEVRIHPTFLETDFKIRFRARLRHQDFRETELLKELLKIFSFVVSCFSHISPSKGWTTVLSLQQYSEIFRNESNNCECPVPCEITKYQVQLSYAQTPAKHFSEVLARRKHVRKDVMRHYLRWGATC